MMAISRIENMTELEEVQMHFIHIQLQENLNSKADRLCQS